MKARHQGMNMKYTSITTKPTAPLIQAESRPKLSLSKSRVMLGKFKLNFPSLGDVVEEPNSTHPKFRQEGKISHQFYPVHNYSKNKNGT